jgi:hypothetical protein
MRLTVVVGLVALLLLPAPAMAWDGHYRPYRHGHHGHHDGHGAEIAAAVVGSVLLGGVLLNILTAPAAPARVAAPPAPPPDPYDDGYTQGYDEGVAREERERYDDGYREGYDAGVRAGRSR